MTSGAGHAMRRTQFRFRLDPDAGVPLSAYIVSALAHVALLLVFVTWPQPPRTPRPLFVPVRLAAAPSLPALAEEARPAAAVEESEALPEPASTPAPVPAPVVEAPAAVPKQAEPRPAPREPPAVREKVGTAEPAQQDDRPAPAPPEPEPEPAKEHSPRRPVQAPPEPAASPRQEDPGVVRQAGVSARFEAPSLPHSQYLDVLVRKISRSWLKPRNTRPSRSAVVRFEISRRGVVSALHVEQGSGVSLFDRKALRAIQLASPLPPLPPAYPHRSLKVHFEFIP